MYTVTFYSYKGGVGRTMALANVAYLLSSAGKRVLVVDFDLEAPGLCTYEAFRASQGRQGIVEYVSQYLETNESPEVEDFIVKCEFQDNPIWIFPAGDFSSSDYHQKLHAINWRELYEERSGFLLLEDMKQQWAQYIGEGFDYVLIDSRTGHTDVGGICTRQLPDAVVVMFVPTPQNINGLKPIVRSIRRERAPVRREKVRLHFCPSNVPDLDDEESILSELISQAETELGYSDNAALIQHYASLDLLQQPIYAAYHPRSRLAKQYEDLKTSLVAGNLFDRDGALTALTMMIGKYRDAQAANDHNALATISTEAAQIRAYFPKDSEVAWGLARLANTMARPEDELTALNTVVEVGGDIRFARLRRAMVRGTLNDAQGAIRDLQLLFAEEPLTGFEARSAIDFLAALAPDEWKSIAKLAIDNPLAESFAKSHVLEALLTTRGSAEEVVKLARRALAEEKERPEVLENALSLALIADGQFAEAMNLLGKERAKVLASTRMATVFNYAVAEWGLNEIAPADLFGRFLELSAEAKDSSDANALQCYALGRMALQRFDEAIEDLRLARLKAEGATRAFSCWRYLTVGGVEMVQDIDAMITLCGQGKLPPPPGKNGFRGALLHS